MKRFFYSSCRWRIGLTMIMANCSTLSLMNENNKHDIAVYRLKLLSCFINLLLVIILHLRKFSYICLECKYICVGNKARQLANDWPKFIDLSQVKNLSLFNHIFGQIWISIMRHKISFSLYFHNYFEHCSKLLEFRFPFETEPGRELTHGEPFILLFNNK